MRRRAIVTATAVVAGCSVIAATAAGAATHKKPLKVKRGHYSVTALPDPTMEATGAAGMECLNIDPASVDNHSLTLPGTGLLELSFAAARAVGLTTVSQLTLVSPLVLPPEGAVRVQVQLDGPEGEEGRRALSIYSRAEDAPAEASWSRGFRCASRRRSKLLADSGFAVATQRER